MTEETGLNLMDLIPGAEPETPASAPAPVPFPVDEEERDIAAERAVTQQDPDAPQQRWYIADKGQAAWAVRKVAQLRADQAENQRIYDSEIAPLLAQIEKAKAWLTGENQALDQHVAFFTSHLEQWHRGVLAGDPKAKTVKLPFGEVSLRAQQPDVTYDEIALVAWLEANRPELVRVKKEPQKADLKKVIEFRPASEVPDGALVAMDTATGEVVAGIKAVERPAKFDVKTAL